MDATKSREPLELAAGDSVKFTRSVPGYSAADGWTCKYEARGGGTLVEWVGAISADGASFDIAVTADQSALYIPGDYVLEGAVSNAALAQRHTFYLGHVKVTQDLDGAPAEQVVTTHAQRVLANIEAVLEGRASNDLLDSTINGTMFKRLTPQQLMDMRDNYLREVGKEQAIERVKNGKPSGKKAKLNYLVTNPAGTLSQFGAGSNQLNFDTP